MSTFFAVSIPVVVAEQLAVLVEVPRLGRGDVGALLLLHKEVEGGESADQAAYCGRFTFIKYCRLANSFSDDSP